jgi:hypothetical protein
MALVVFDVDYLRVGVGAAEDLPVEHARELHVKGVRGPARYLRNSIYIVYMCIDDRIFA